MKKIITLLGLNLIIFFGFCQSEPPITSFLQNTTETGTYYMAGNSTVIDNNILVNCQQVEYSDDYVYITCTGIPSYPTGPFQDGNPSQAENQNAIFKIPLSPEPASGNNTATSAGNIGIFINGVALFDYRDGVAWDPTTNALCGGPGNPPCPGGMGVSSDWNRDAIPAENEGFDCSKGHPAMGNYHHHQNPSAFNLDLIEISEVCNLYAADGLYTINSSEHSPLIGFAYDGYPIYGAMGYTNNDGSGEITRMKSGYQLRDITSRNTWADGTAVDNGPDISSTYWLGYFREDYEFISHDEDDYLDEHNGRNCITPEYPDGTYAYFCTVDENWNSAYPYAVGPTFYGNYANAAVSNVSEVTTVYNGENSISAIHHGDLDVSIYPNPSADLIAVQVNGVVKENLTAELLDLQGKLVQSYIIHKGSTIAYFDVQGVYSGNYIIRITGINFTKSKEVIIKH